MAKVPADANVAADMLARIAKGIKMSHHDGHNQAKACI